MQATLIRKATFKHIESELYSYHDSLKEIEQLRLDIIHCRTNEDENTGGGRSSRPSQPTEQIGTALATNKKLGELEKITSAIKKIYEEAPEDYKNLIKLKYWTKPQYLTWDGIADRLHVSKRQAMRWRDEVVYAISEVVGWR